MSKTLLVAFLSISSLALAAGGLTPADIVKAPEKYDGKVVKVRGIVKNFKAKTSKSGNDYLVFELTAGSDKVAVYSHGKLVKALKDGDKVEVEGKFSKLKTVGKATFKNEIDCSGKKGEKPNISAVK